MNAHYVRGMMLYQQSRYELAEQELHQAMADEPNNASAHALLALCLCERKEFSAATREAEEAIRLAPDAAFPHYTLAHILYDRDQLPQAEAAIGEALRLAPEDADYHALLASIRFNQRRWADALAAAEQGLQLDAENTLCANARAMALVQLGRRAEAGATIDEALRRDPEDALTHANQGWTLLGQNQPHQAMEHFREALRLEPNLEWARMGIVEALKARHWLYRQMLRYFLWMGRRSSSSQGAVIIGLFFAQYVLASAIPPALAPLGDLVFWGLIVFVVLTWTADPLFNLLLRMNRFGRQALSHEQIRASNWVGACLFLALVSLVCWAVSGDGRFSLAALVSGCLVLPVAAVFKSRAGRPRLLMGLYTILLAVLGGSGVGIFFIGDHLPRHTWQDALAAAKLLLGMFFLGVVASTWLFNLLLLARRRR